MKEQVDEMIKIIDKTVKSDDVKLKPMQLLYCVGSNLSEINSFAGPKGRNEQRGWTVPSDGSISSITRLASNITFSDYGPFDIIEVKPTDRNYVLLFFGHWNDGVLA